ncbi:hypothetical protein KFK09_002826 [Dendrobium nobile]|uniref:DUF569 domain-containing protein n=1 Tax=Dendrobium nobile TaxID=94219 RepID=A0A8T3C2F7_DENNO|nr:hypothetical protein KFK09_002826 [Dendrobium nobile]
MELFERAKAVRLRSHNDKYLLAEDDEERVCQHRNGTTRKARWQVELVDAGDQPLIRLKSCYGKYLSASNEPLLLGVTGRKVLQAAPGRRLDSSLEWEPIRDGFQVKLKTRYGQFLRANGGPPPWRNTVTHDIPHLHHDWVLWEVDIVEARAYTPVAFAEYSPAAEVESSPATESVESSPSFSKQESLWSASSGSPRAFHSRTINYMVANNDGNVEAGAEEFSFSFQGTSVEELTQKLEEESELGHIIVCSKNPVNGKLYPLRLQLPPNKNTMNVVVVLASSKAAKILAKQENLL